MQLAYNRAQVGTRAAKWINPKQGELLIPDRASAFKQIDALERQLKGQMPRHKRAELLIARAMILEAVGSKKMLEAASDAWDFSKTAITAHLMAVGHHHFGQMDEACKYYTLAYKYPHEEGFNIDLAYTQALLFQGNWTAAHKMTLGLKKRMVYAAYLPEWDGKLCPELSIISEGGFGDITHCGRWIPILRDMGIKVTVYLPPYFFEHGFVDLMKRQSWCPDVKLLTETPQKVPAIGFFDLPAIFNVQPNNIPPSLTFEADPELVRKYSYLRGGLPQVGFCWAARAMETPLCPDGVYRSLTEQQANQIISASIDKVRLVKLQKGFEELLGPMARPEIQSWEDTAAIIANLDAVITVDTAVAHLAAAMGKPTYVLLSGAYDWKYREANNDKCEWYPSMTLVRNNDFGFDNAVSSLCEQIQTNVTGEY